MKRIKFYFFAAILFTLTVNPVYAQDDYDIYIPDIHLDKSDGKALDDSIKESIAFFLESIEIDPAKTENILSLIDISSQSTNIIEKDIIYESVIPNTLHKVYLSKNRVNLIELVLVAEENGIDLKIPNTIILNTFLQEYYLNAQQKVFEEMFDYLTLIKEYAIDYKIDVNGSPKNVSIRELLRKTINQNYSSSIDKDEYNKTKKFFENQVQSIDGDRIYEVNLNFSIVANENIEILKNIFRHTLNITRLSNEDDHKKWKDFNDNITFITSKFFDEGNIAWTYYRGDITKMIIENLRDFFFNLFPKKYTDGSNEFEILDFRLNDEGDYVNFSPLLSNYQDESLQITLIRDRYDNTPKPASLITFKMNGTLNTRYDVTPSKEYQTYLRRSFDWSPLNDINNIKNERVYGGPGSGSGFRLYKYHTDSPPKEEPFHAKGHELSKFLINSHDIIQQSDFSFIEEVETPTEEMELRGVNKIDNSRKMIPFEVKYLGTVLNFTKIKAGAELFSFDYLHITDRKGLSSVGKFSAIH